MRLDHFVVHIDNDEQILADLKSRIEPLGFPFEPKWGKGTRGFKAANIWIGRQYFEIIRLLRPDGGGWTPRWVTQYRNGQRGLYCIFLAVDNIAKVAESLKRVGLGVATPERISFKAFFGLIAKTLPWQILYLPKIPGTGIEIGFIQYDPDPNDRIRKYLVPNSDEHGIFGISSAILHLPLTLDAMEFLRKVFPDIEIGSDECVVPIQSGALTFRNAADVQADLEAVAPDKKMQGKHFLFENISVST